MERPNITELILGSILIIAAILGMAKLEGFMLMLSVVLLIGLAINITWLEMSIKYKKYQHDNILEMEELLQWLLNNWFTPCSSGLWRQLVEHPEYRRTIPGEDTHFTVEEIITLFRSGAGEH